MPKLAVIILTKNEENNIEDAIVSASFADEIIVVDSGSTDKTQELVERQGAVFITHPMSDAGFAGQRNFALTQTEADWVFFLDADERVMPEFISKLKVIINSGKKKAYCLERKNVVFGQQMNYGVHRPDYSCRLYPRTAISWQGRIHEVVKTDLPYENIDNCLLHYTYTSWAKYFDKFNQYTSMAAREMANAGKQISSTAILGHTFGAFFKAYILKQGFRDGFLGFVMSFMAMTYTLTKYMKLKNIYRIKKLERNGYDSAE